MSAAAAEALRDFLSPLLPGWVIQLGAWDDTVPAAKTSRFAVIRPAGGGRAELVRRPAISLLLIGRDGGDVLEVARQADAVVEAMRASAGALIFLQPAEPAFMPTRDRRPVFDIAVSAITH